MGDPTLVRAAVRLVADLQEVALRADGLEHFDRRLAKVRQRYARRAPSWTALAAPTRGWPVGDPTTAMTKRRNSAGPAIDPPMRRCGSAMVWAGGGARQGQMPSRTRRRDESQLLEREATVFDEGGGVLVHPHGDQRAGVAEPAGDRRHRDLLGDQPDSVGVAQVVEVQPAVAGPGMPEPGSSQGGFPNAGEVVAGQRDPAAAAAGWGGEDPVVRLRLVEEALPVVVEGLDGGLVEGDGALGGRGR